MSTKSDQANQAVIKASSIACDKINDFSKKVLLTRGGRMGSGMGTLLEALWCDHVNQELIKNEDCKGFC